MENPGPLCELHISYALLPQDVIDVFGLSNMNKQHESHYPLLMNPIAFLAYLDHFYALTWIPLEQRSTLISLSVLITLLLTQKKKSKSNGP